VRLVVPVISAYNDRLRDRAIGAQSCSRSYPARVVDVLTRARREQCSVCGATLLVVDGLIERHTDPDYRVRETCAGAGRPPKVTPAIRPRPREVTSHDNPR